MVRPKVTRSSGACVTFDDDLAAPVELELGAGAFKGVRH